MNFRQEFGNSCLGRSTCEPPARITPADRILAVSHAGVCDRRHRGGIIFSEAQRTPRRLFEAFLAWFGGG